MNDKLLERLKKISILCVEDEDGIRSVIVNTLRYYFDSVYEARDGKEAYDVYLKFQPKIILCDIQMKNQNGIEFVKKIRQIDKQTNIIMLTAYSKEEYLLELINLNINHFILKPLNSKKLNEALEKCLNEELQKSILLYPNLFLDLEKRELIYDEDKIVGLRKREKDFLYLLYQKKDGILTYSQIEQELWHDKEMTTYALKSFIKDLRAKLPINIIKNIPQEGYTLLKNEKGQK